MKEVSDGKQEKKRSQFREEATEVQCRVQARGSALAGKWAETGDSVGATTIAHSKTSHWRPTSPASMMPDTGIRKSPFDDRLMTISHVRLISFLSSRDHEVVA